MTTSATSFRLLGYPTEISTTMARPTRRRTVPISATGNPSVACMPDVRTRASRRAFPRLRCKRSPHSPGSLRQWIDLPPFFHLPDEHASAHSHSGRNSPASGSPHSPPIYKTPSRFFDSLTEADRARTKLRPSSAASDRHSAGASPAVTPLADGTPVGSAPRNSPLQPGSQTQEAATSSSAPSLEPHCVELQFQPECIAPFAHHGYVVCPRSAAFCLLRFGSCFFFARSTVSPSPRATSTLSSFPDVSPVSPHLQDEHTHSGSPDSSWRREHQRLAAGRARPHAPGDARIRVRRCARFRGARQYTLCGTSRRHHQGALLGRCPGFGSWTDTPGARQVWDLDSLTCVRILRPHRVRLNHLDFFRPGTILTCLWCTARHPRSERHLLFPLLEFGERDRPKVGPADVPTLWRMACAREHCSRLRCAHLEAQSDSGVASDGGK